MERIKKKNAAAALPRTVVIAIVVVRGRRLFITLRALYRYYKYYYNILWYKCTCVLVV